MYQLKIKVKAKKNLIISYFVFTVCFFFAPIDGGIAWGQTPKIADPELSATRSRNLDVLGQIISLTNPDGYCTLGSSLRERELAEINQNSVGETVRPIHIAIRCAELERFKTGRSKIIDHWLQIQLLGPKGEFKKLQMSRESFLAGLAGSGSRVSLNRAEIMKKLNESIKNLDVDRSNYDLTQLGRDGNALYFLTRLKLASEKNVRNVTGMGAITLLNSLPLSVIVYEAEGTARSRTEMQSTLHQTISLLLSEN